MFKCCVSGAKEDVEEAKKERAKRNRKQTNPPSTAASDGGRSGTAITSGTDDIGPPALVTGSDRGKNVASGA